MYFYSSSVITGAFDIFLDDGVLVVGYDTDNSGAEYWKVKNSLGSTCSDQEYALISRNVVLYKNQVIQHFNLIV